MESMTAFLSNGLFFSEILADNAGGQAFDTDGDGGANKADEFIELQSATNATINLDGIELWSAKRGQLFDFSQGDTIGPNGTVTVVGQYDGTPPAGFFDAGLPDNNSNSGFLEDGELNRNDTLFLVDTNTGEFVTLSYGTPPVLLPPSTGFPGTIRVGDEAITSDAPNGVAFIRDGNGDFVTDPNPMPGIPGVPCFAEGTLIMTSTGEQPVEALSPGDRILTRDAGLQPLLWVGHRRLGSDELATRPELRPYRIAAGSLGIDRPKADLVLSPQHRVLIRSKIASRMFGKAEVLSPVKQLSACPGITQMRVTDVAYYHLLLPDHHIIWANGAECESLYLGPEATKSLSREAIVELSAIFPAIGSGATPIEAARQLLAGRRARQLVSRHIKNSKALVA